MEIKLTPRDYQKQIFEACKENSCLVILPTGTGKTLIALLLAIYKFEKEPLKKIVFLAPTRPLVEQHLASFKKNIPDGWAQMDLFTGKTEAPQRKKIWQTAEFIFSTPQCISNDLKKGLYDLSEVSLLIEDECHRCLKNYAYNFISQKYKEQNQKPHVLGMTASPGSDKATIKKVCENLGIERVEIRTRDSPDVKPYLQELEFEKIDIDFPLEFEEVRVLMNEIYQDKVSDLKNMKMIFGFISKTQLLELQKKLFMKLNSGDKNPLHFSAISACSQAIKLQHAIELLETQSLSSFINYQKEIFKQANEKTSKSVQILAKDVRFNKAHTIATTLDVEHPKLNKIIEIIKEALDKNPKSKTIIFAQFRETAKKIADALEKDPRIKPGIFVGQTKKEHDGGKSSTGLNQKEQKEMIEKFARGELNVLCATSIAEEGLDIPEVNEVVFYEPVPSAIRKIQRAGRTARLFPGKLKILVTKNTRDQSYHYAAQSKEKRMHNAIKQIKEDLDNGQKELDFS
ncbi:ATP-dependent RNA helicase SrmB [uncultured archaeon]|nr:ATP-dependent RNA helicase SrmB [uncultured archaeon]